ncbi:hypothetical protein [Moorena producens]|uniref:hypothetical protein n=1 Tax=Moorena producens TaxID=1155739 RepID=UPI0011EA6912|nr:hypothetical protein [Moorena producens]
MGSLQTTGYSREFININPNDIFLIYQLPAISYQLSAISEQRLAHLSQARSLCHARYANSYQLSTKDHARYLRCYQV